MPESIACLDLRGAVVAAIGHCLKPLLAHRLAGSRGHRRELRPVAARVGHLVRHDEVVLRVHCNLHVVADDAGAATAGGHGPRVRIGQRELAIGLVLQLLLDAVHATHLLAHRSELVL